MSDKFAVMTAGLPGVGKTTWRKELIDILQPGWSTKITSLSSDDFIEEYARENGMTYNQAFPLANSMEKFEKAFSEALDRPGGHMIILDQTNVSMKARMAKVRRFLQKGFLVDIVWWALPKDDVAKDKWVAALKARELKEGKVIPLHILNSMMDSFHPPQKEEGFRLIEEKKGWYNA